MFHQIYGGKEIDPQLFSGFLSGLYRFSKEVSGTGGIEQLELEEMRLLYGVFPEVIIIVAVTKDEDVDTIRKKIADIHNVFINKYKEYLINWDGNVGIFEPFKRDLDLIIEKMRHVDFIEVPIKIPQKKRLKLSNEEFQVLSYCDGKTASLTIANKLKISEFKLIHILKTLEKKKIIQRKMVMKI